MKTLSARAKSEEISEPEEESVRKRGLNYIVLYM